MRSSGTQKPSQPRCCIARCSNTHHEPFGRNRRHVNHNWPWTFEQGEEVDFASMARCNRRRQAGDLSRDGWIHGRESETNWLGIATGDTVLGIASSFARKCLRSVIEHALARCPSTSTNGSNTVQSIVFAAARKRLPILTVVFVMTTAQACSEPDVACTGEELDFAVVGDLQGLWKCVGVEIEVVGYACEVEFDESGRLRRQQRGHTPTEYGCDPGQKPLVPNGLTVKHNGLDLTDYYRLIEWNVEEGKVDLVHQTRPGGGLEDYLRIQLEGESLFLNVQRGAQDFMFQNPPREYRRVQPGSP